MTNLLAQMKGKKVILNIDSPAGILDYFSTGG